MKIMPKAYLSSITLPSGSQYYFKDEDARTLIEALSSGTAFMGVTTTEIADGSTTKNVTIGG
jgi:VCBS repeat-containing protein